MHGIPFEFVRRAIVETERWDVKSEKVCIDERDYIVVVLPCPDETAFDRPWKSLFIEWLRRGVTIEKAAHLSGVSRTYPYDCRAKDEDFRKAWDDARDEKRQRRRG